MTARSLAIPLALWFAATACSELTEPAGGVRGAKGASETPPSRVAPAVSTVAAPAGTPPPMVLPRQEPAGEAVRASHVLVSYAGAMRAKPDLTRSKDEAKQRAERIAQRAKKGEDFAALAKEASDDPAGARGGDLGKFTKDRMVKPFADAAFALKPGEISGVVETQFGFHVIKRTE